ncbi:methyltransferase [Actinoallomurus spadix]|uniref:Methyltransferase n=1 Tax=Actinoallomurus spadix TaxID=79912 RepID=A0ABN0X8Q6_9ACTN|nr:methyltransferase [Actinoallomurus spadix]MCO5984496.1 methyltransferase [Actinoallomurus spadix]
MSDEEVDFRALSDLATPWCVRVVATLGVAEHMAAGVTHVDELARKADCDGDSLARVLRHLVDKGLFQEPAEAEFTLNEPARVLLDPRVRGGLDLDGSAGRLAGAWSGLLAAVRTGRPTYERVFGLPFWQDLEANPDIAASYDRLMGLQGRGVPDPAILVDDDWADVRHVVDVGGGTGAMLAEILRAHPRVRGTLVDLPRTVARSAEVFEAAGVADRVTVSGQSFLDPLPGGADVYLLASVLLDWPDDQAITLLTRCAEAAAPNGRVVVIGGVTPGSAASKGALVLMVMTGGRTRNLDQFRALAAKAGLTVTASGQGPSGRFIVESRPA